MPSLTLLIITASNQRRTVQLKPKTHFDRTWAGLWLEAFGEEAADVLEAFLLNLGDDGRLELRCFVPGKFSSEPVDDVEQENFEVAATRNG